MDPNRNLRIDQEDLDDVLAVMERSFAIKCSARELTNVKTYGEFCNCIITKIEYKELDDYATQQAFCKLREAILKITNTEEAMIRPEVSLDLIFPKNKRRYQIKKLEEALGFELDLLTPKGFIIVGLIVLMICSFITLFVSRTYGIIGLLASFAGLLLASRLGKEFNVNTIRDLTEKITAENYLKARRWKNTINKQELEKQIDQLFSKRLGLKKEDLKKEALTN
jgi:hypothetical protein